MKIRERISRFLNPEPVTYEFYELSGGSWKKVLESDTPITKDQVADRMTPGNQYKVMTRNKETGKIAKGKVWSHYETDPRIREYSPPSEGEPRRRTPTRPSDWAGAYAKEVKETLTPMVELVTTFQELMMGFSQALSINQGEGGGEGYPQIPPLSFSGQAPWFLHPWVMDYAAGTIQKVIDHFFEEAKGMMEGPKKETEKKEETTFIEPPNPDRYLDEEEEE